MLYMLLGCSGVDGKWGCMDDEPELKVAILQVKCCKELYGCRDVLPGRLINCAPATCMDGDPGLTVQQR